MNKHPRMINGDVVIDRYEKVALSVRQEIKYHYEIIRPVFSDTIDHFHHNRSGEKCQAAQLARNIPGSTVRIVDSGHLMGAERADEVNAGIMAFFAESAQPGPDDNNEDGNVKGDSL
jgi:hypothetical protein